MNLSATATRESALADGVEKIANGIAIGNVISSLAAEITIIIGGAMDPPWVALLAGGLAFADFGLDLGRGIYEWHEVPKHIASGDADSDNDNNDDDGDDDGAGEKAVALGGDYSSTHRIVTY